MSGKPDSSERRATRAAIILCGGNSLRMGTPKHALRFGAQTALQRIVGAVSPLVQHVVVVTAQSQRVDTPAHVRVTVDRVPDQGPLEGVGAGWEALPDELSAAFICSCDLPLLTEKVVEKLFGAQLGWDAAVPVEGTHQHALCAVYASETRRVVNELRHQQIRQMTQLLAALRVRRVPTDQFREVDPALGSFLNVNTPEDYARAIAHL